MKCMYDVGSYILNVSITVKSSKWPFTFTESDFSPFTTVAEKYTLKLQSLKHSNN